MARASSLFSRMATMDRPKGECLICQMMINATTKKMATNQYQFEVKASQVNELGAPVTLVHAGMVWWGQSVRPASDVTGVLPDDVVERLRG